MYESILVGFDESQYSKAALIEVANWTKDTAERLFLSMLFILTRKNSVLRLHNWKNV